MNWMLNNGWQEWVMAEAVSDDELMNDEKNNDASEMLQAAIKASVVDDQAADSVSILFNKWLCLCIRWYL